MKKDTSKDIAPAKDFTDGYESKPIVRPYRDGVDFPTAKPTNKPAAKAPADLSTVDTFVPRSIPRATKGGNAEGWMNGPAKPMNEVEEVEGEEPIEEALAHAFLAQFVAPVEPVVEPIVEAPAPEPTVEPIVSAPEAEPTVDATVEAKTEAPQEPIEEASAVESVAIVPVEASVVESIIESPVEAPVVEAIVVAPVETPKEEAPVETPKVEPTVEAPRDEPVMEALAVSDGALAEVPVFDHGRGGRNWLAKIKSDATAKDGIGRVYQRSLEGELFYNISGLEIGDVVEFGAGRRLWYGVVCESDKKNMTIEKFDDATSALAASMASDKGTDAETLDTLSKSANAGVRRRAKKAIADRKPIEAPKKENRLTAAMSAEAAYKSQNSGKKTGAKVVGRHGELGCGRKGCRGKKCEEDT